MAFTLGQWNPQTWNGKFTKGLVRASSVLRVASGPGGTLKIMKSGSEKIAIGADFHVKAYGRLEPIQLQSPEMDEFDVRARKIEGMAQIAEEDLVEGRAYDVDIVKDLTESGRANTGVYYDNACLATVGAATPGEVNIIRPYDSVYQRVATGPDAANRLLTIAADATPAEFRTAIKATIESAERTKWARDMVVMMDPIWVSYFRDFPTDGSNGALIWNEAQGTLLGHRYEVTDGAKKTTAATDTPTGNPLFIVGPRAHFVATRAPFSTGNAAVPEAFLSDPTTGIGMENDSAFLKIRARWGFSAGPDVAVNAFSVLELTPAAP